MAQLASKSQVLTLEDAAEYLRLPVEAVSDYASRGEIPGRRIEGSWRFLLAALEDWLRHDPRKVLLGQVGALAEDTSLEELLADIYKRRGRPEIGS